MNRKAQKLSSDDRSQVYAYLESHLPFSKQIWVNEVNKFTIAKVESSLKSLKTSERQVQKLITEIMPNALDNYQVELKSVNDLRAAAKLSDKSEQQFKDPRKKFPWNENLR